MPRCPTGMKPNLLLTHLSTFLFPADSLTCSFTSLLGTMTTCSRQSSSSSIQELGASVVALAAYLPSWLEAHRAQCLWRPVISSTRYSSGVRAGGRLWRWFQQQQQLWRGPGQRLRWRMAVALVPASVVALVVAWVMVLSGYGVEPWAPGRP